MIKLNHIDYDFCPECHAVCHQMGLETSYDGKINQHVSGDRWEYVVFTCGRKDVFIPNFMSIETKSPCRNSAEETIKASKRVTAYNSAKALIEGLDVDASYKDSMLRSLHNPRYI